ncbi:MAG TPA: winged helix-turn-helix domain-containing protein [Candidatus Acidoferrum sp.]|nr:winged helix-turn-helix domain-containing protein [Candidatus Acidoferrum sp.]
MTLSSTDRRICRFGLYEADLAAARLTKQGIPIKLQEQPFRILALLLERAGGMVTREELRTLLWPQGTYVEFDGSVNTALTKLRAALNDDPDNPRFIETVPRKGYRFIAPVQFLEGNEDWARGTLAVAQRSTEPIADHGEDSRPPGTERARDARSYRARFGLTLSTAVLAILAAVLAALLWRYWPAAQPEVVRVTALTHTGKVAPGSRIVTDGARVYFVAEQEGKWELLQTSVRGGSAERVAAPFDSTAVLDVSPDHSQLLIAPFSHIREAMPLWLWPAHGGAPHRLGDVTATEATWSPAGQLIAFAREDKLFVVRPEGTQMKEIASFSSPPHSLVWSPDGESLRFTVSSLNNRSDEIWEITKDGRNLHQPLGGETDTHELGGAWADHGRYFLFTAGLNSHVTLAVDTLSNIWVEQRKRFFFRAARENPLELTHGPVSFTQLAASSVGTRIFALGTHPEYQLIRVGTKSQNVTRLLDDAGATTVDYSPDGAWIVYALRQNGSIWKSRRDGSGRVELTSTPPGAFAPSWSPDGKKILFTAFSLGKQPQLYVIPSEGGTPQPVLPPGIAGSTISGDWSPDSREIVMDYMEPGKDLRPHLQILDVATGKITELAGTEGWSQPRWAPDGKHFAAVDQGGHRILMSDGEGENWKYLAEAKSPREIYWSSDSKFVYFQDTGDEEQSVFRASVETSKTEKILGFKDWLENGAAQCHFTGVGPDGSIYATIDHGGTDLYAVDVKLP